MTDLGSSVPSPLRGQTDTGLQKYRKEAFTINHIVGINSLSWPTAPGIQRHCYQAGYSKGLELISLKRSRTTPFFRMCNVWSARLSLYCIDMEVSKFLLPAHLATCAQAYMLHTTQKLKLLQTQFIHYCSSHLRVFQ